VDKDGDGGYDDIYDDIYDKEHNRECKSELNSDYDNGSDNDRKLTQEEVAVSPYVDSQRPLLEEDANTEEVEAARRDKLDAETSRRLVLLLIVAAARLNKREVDEDWAEERYCTELRQTSDKLSSKEIAERLASLEKYGKSR